MEKVKAFDVNSVEIKRNDIVKIVSNDTSKHAWLKAGNTLRVAYWENRSFGKVDYIVVFLKSKKGGKLCSQGVQDRFLKVIEEGE